MSCNKQLFVSTSTETTSAKLSSRAYSQQYRRSQRKLLQTTAEHTPGLSLHTVARRFLQIPGSNCGILSITLKSEVIVTGAKTSFLLRHILLMFFFLEKYSNTSFIDHSSKKNRLRTLCLTDVESKKILCFQSF